MSQRRGAAGATDFAAFDALGSTAQLTNSGQAVTDSYLLDVWGNPISTTGSTPNPHRFVGELGYYFVPALGLYYIRDQWYEPSTGLFLVTALEDARFRRFFLVGRYLGIWHVLWGSFGPRVRNAILGSGRESLRCERVSWTSPAHILWSG